jgi:hypothetical protein
LVLSLRKNSEPKNCWFWLFQKPLRTDAFHQRIDDSLASSSTFSYFLRIVVIYQNRFVEYSENWGGVSGYLPGLITGGYLHSKNHPTLVHSLSSPFFLVTGEKV